MSALTDILAAGSPSAVNAGWSQLGRSLGGAAGQQRNAYQTGVLQGVQQEDALEQARRRRDQNLGFAQVTPQVIADSQSNDPATRAAGQSQLVAALIHAQTSANPNESTQALGNLQRQNEQNTVFGQAQGGASIPSINAELAAESGKPVQTTDIKDNTIYDPYATPAGQAAEGGNAPTQIGNASIANILSEANEHRAQAGAANAEAAARYGGMNHIETDSNGNAVLVNDASGQTKAVLDTGGNNLALASGAGKGVSNAALKPEEIEEALGKAKAGGTPNATYVDYKNFQTLHAQDDPAYNNDRYALSQYLLAKQGTSMLANTPGRINIASAAGAEDQPSQSTSQDDDQEQDRPSTQTLSSLITGSAPSNTAPSAAPTPAPTIQVGQTATNPKTGQKLTWNGQQWVPYGG
jgi:hypothetical protein